jgi:hypothetical protein
MKLYNVLIKKNSADEIEDIVIIKDGFSLNAFLFSALWFLYHKMNKEFWILIAFNILFAVAAKIFNFSYIDDLILQTSFFYLVAINANNWLIEDLQKKDYQNLGVVFGKNLVEAKIRFIDKFSLENPNQIKNINLNSKIFL